MWAFLSLFSNSTGNFYQVRLNNKCRLNKAIQAPGFRTRDLQWPEAKSFSCFLKLRFITGCMRIVQRGCSERLLSFPFLSLSTDIHIASAETTGTAGTDPAPLRFHT